MPITSLDENFIKKGELMEQEIEQTKKPKTLKSLMVKRVLKITNETFDYQETPVHFRKRKKNINKLTQHFKKIKSIWIDHLDEKLNVDEFEIAWELSLRLLRNIIESLWENTDFLKLSNEEKKIVKTTYRLLDPRCTILDLYENPVKVDAEELFELAIQRWQEQLNAWLLEYESLNQKR